MLTTYYVNKNSQSDSGDHEVHAEGCAWLPYPQNREYLGMFLSCTPAVAKAKLSYPSANGCFYCSRTCHTS